MTQNIPLSWLRGKQIHPCKYHNEIMRMLQYKPRTRYEIGRMFPHILLEPDNKDGIDVILNDLFYNGMAQPCESRRKVRGKEVMVEEWRIESLTPYNDSFFRGLYT